MVFLPLTAVEAPSALDVAAHDYAGFKGSSEHILPIDDELQILKFQNRILEQHGYAVTTEREGLSAYERFTDDPQSFDLIISDISIPGPRR